MVGEINCPGSASTPPGRDTRKGKFQVRKYHTPTVYVRKHRVMRYDGNGNRWCGHCKTYKPESAFKPSAKRYRSSICQDCERLQGRKRIPKIIADLWLKRYGISEQQYWQTFDDQRGLCAVCGNPESTTKQGGIKLLSVDHDHKTGNVRALLCHACNTALGHTYDDPLILRKLADYLEVYK